MYIKYIYIHIYIYIYIYIYTSKESVTLAKETRLIVYGLYWPERSPCTSKALSNGTMKRKMILLQPVLDCSKQRHSFLRTHSPLQKKYSSCKEIQKKESRKSLDYNKMSKKIENFSKLVQGALFETHRSQDQIVPSKTLRSESFL